MFDAAAPHIDLVVRGKPTFDEGKHYLGKLCIHGHNYEGTGKSWRHRGHRNCVTCTRERAHSWNKENPARVKASERRRKDRLRGGPAAERRQRWPILNSVTAAVQRARKAGIPANINGAYMREVWKQQDGRCYWTGIPLDFRVGRERDARRPALDRLIPKLGYVRGNVVWASNFANRARSDMDAEEFRAVLRGFCESVLHTGQEIT